MSPSLPKIQDEDRESKYGYVFAVSGPGELLYHSQFVQDFFLRLNVLQDVVWLNKGVQNNILNFIIHVILQFLITVLTGWFETENGTTLRYCIQIMAFRICHTHGY